MISKDRLGNYIEKLNRPNSSLQYGEDDVCGITNTKKLVPGTKANLIGRTFEKFTILAPGEFIFNRRTSRNGEKISLGYNTTNREWILTEDYCHFKVKDENTDIIDPDFLYIFFLDPEFDRYVRFNSWGSATEFFNWEEMVEVPVPLLPIDEQRLLVKRYKAIDNRIDTLKQTIELLKSVARDYYGMCFASKDGNGILADIIQENPKSAIQVGTAKLSKGKYPFFTSGDTLLKWDEAMVEGRNCFLNTGGIAGLKFYIGAAAYSTDTWCIAGKSEYSDYLYLLLDSIMPELDLKYFQGTGLKHLQKPLLKKRSIYVPSQAELDDFNRMVRPVNTYINDKELEIRELNILKEGLLPTVIKRCDA